MENLQTGKEEETFRLLKVAEETIINNQKVVTDKTLLAMTLNNLGCYYKFMGNTSLALFYLKNAIINSGSTVKDKVNIAGAYLNICAIFSKKENHDSALKSAQKGFGILEEVFDKAVEMPFFVTTLVIAHFNIAVELERLKKFEAADEYYRKGYSVACQYLGDEHELAIKLKGAIVSEEDFNVLEVDTFEKEKQEKRNEFDNERTLIPSFDREEFRRPSTGAGYLTTQYRDSLDSLLDSSSGPILKPPRPRTGKNKIRGQLYSNAIQEPKRIMQHRPKESRPRESRPRTSQNSSGMENRPRAGHSAPRMQSRPNTSGFQPPARNWMGDSPTLESANSPRGTLDHYQLVDIQSVPTTMKSSVNNRQQRNQPKASSNIVSPRPAAAGRSLSLNAPRTRRRRTNRLRRKIREPAEPEPATLLDLAEAIQTIDQKLSNLEITLPQSTPREPTPTRQRYYPKYGKEQAAVLIQKQIRRYLVQRQYMRLMHSANQLQHYTGPPTPRDIPSPVRFATPDKPKIEYVSQEVQTPDPVIEEHFIEEPVVEEPIVNDPSVVVSPSPDVAMEKGRESPEESSKILVGMITNHITELRKKKEERDKLLNRNQNV